MAQRKCGFKDCSNDLNPGVGISVNFGAGREVYLKVCEYDADLLRRSKPGMFRITPTLRFQPIPAVPVNSKGKK